MRAFRELCSFFMCMYIMISIKTNLFKPNINENVVGQVLVKLFQFLIVMGNPGVFYLLCALLPYFKVNYLGECLSRNAFPSTCFQVLKAGA